MKEHKLYNKGNEKNYPVRLSLAVYKYTVSPWDSTVYVMTLEPTII